MKTAPTGRPKLDAVAMIVDDGVMMTDDDDGEGGDDEHDDEDVDYILHSVAV